MNITLLREPPSIIDRPPEQHDCFEVLLCESGHGVMELDGRSLAIGPGDLICIPPHTVHRDRSSEPRTNAIVQFPPERFSPTGSVCQLRDTGHSFLNMFNLALEAQLGRYPNADALIGAIGEAMFQLLRCWSGGSGQTSSSAERVHREILDRFSDPDFDLAASIRDSGYNINYFRRLFKTAYGYPPLEYLSRVRIEYAKSQFRLYRRTLSIQEIARSAGFSDPAYFSRVFRQTEGFTPSQYLSALPDGTA